MPDPDTGEIQWYNPDPRAIIPLDKFHCSRSLKRTLRKGIFSYSLNQDFLGVMEGCADRASTWINHEFKNSYFGLYQEGFAHSVEVCQNGMLVGGVYGVALGGAFFAESKFHRVTDASKVALFYLVEHLKKKGFILLEVQFLIPHLERLGAIEISREKYQLILQQALNCSVFFK